MRVSGVKGVKPEIVRLIRTYARRLSQVSPDRHGVVIKVVPAPAIAGPDGGFGFGLFVCRDDQPGNPSIVIAGERVDELTQHEWLMDMLPETLAHEWAHYEQWRDGKPVQERGVAVRARGLMRKAAIP